MCWHYLSSRAVTRQVLSALVSLTSVFGMGTGGPSQQSIPTHMDGSSPSFIVKSLPASNHFILAHPVLPVNCFLRTAGDPYRIRTDVKGVRGLCLNRLTNGPHKSRRLPIFTSRFQLTIFGTSKLNFCVRNGNRWNLTVIDTDRSD